VAAEADPNVETWMLFTDIILIYRADAGAFWLAVDDENFSQRFLKKKPMEFGSWTTRELLIPPLPGCAGRLPCRCALHSAAAAGRMSSRRAMSWCSSPPG
jgi:CPA1 family monovalent cation:H+ antiporter